MEIKKREYFLRGGLNYTAVTDEFLYSTYVSADEFSGWYNFYKGRGKVYEFLGFGSPNSYQKYWIYQRYRDESVITLGPVGIGKTTFSIIEALLSENKVIFVVPTRVLAENVHERLAEFAKKVKADKKILVYNSSTRDNVLEGDFDIVVLTAQAFRHIFSKVNWKSNLSIVDDVDAFVKNPRNLDRLIDITTGSIILSSATFKASPKQKKRLIENFNISFKKSVSVGFRNIEDLYLEPSDEKDVIEEVANFIKYMGHGGLVFLSRGSDEDSVIETLKGYGIRAEKGNEETLKLLENRKLDVLVGKSVFYGTLVRGLDVPDVIRYTVFLGVPRGEFTIKKGEDISKWWKTFVGKSLPDSWDEIREKINEMAIQRTWSIQESEDSIKIIYPDITTYIQASGRTSRFIGTGFTFGVSLVTDIDRDILYSFIKRASLQGINFKPVSDVDLADLKTKTFDSREESKSESIIFKSYLMLVESPHKVETITSLLGGGVLRYFKLSENWIVTVSEVSFGTTLFIIAATVGHTSDIVEIVPAGWPQKTVYGVSVEEDGFYPIMDTIKLGDDGSTFVVLQKNTSYRDKLELIKLYREFLLSLDGLLVATDPDSEGERIAYEVVAYLKPFTKTVKRMEFREITRKALENAFNQTREIDTRKVEAALTRRIEDRWLGFFLSEQLMKSLGKSSLSAGRVQSPVLGWIIQNHRLFNEKKTVYRVFLPFVKDFYIGTDKKPPENVRIKNLQIDTLEKNPQPPYTTDALLIDASRFLKFPASYTMKLAQDLFEEGFITYHRTDSTRVSDDGLRIAQIYLKDMFKGRKWGITVSKHVQEAHECIRPSKPIDINEFRSVAPENFTRDHAKLYNLIFRRFMAAQSIPALIKELALDIEEIGNLKIPIEIIKEGYLKLYQDIKIYPLVSLPDKEMIKIFIKKVKRPKAYPFKEEDVVKLMKEKGIGRPSTYGKILEVIKSRNYVKISPKGFLIPTELGVKVWNFLNNNYKKFVMEERTAELYDKMDAIEEGKQDYMKLLKMIFEEIF